jgi:hypothetical protein
VLYFPFSALTIDVASVCSSGRFIRSPKRKKLPFTPILDTSVPLFCQPALAVHGIGLTENGFLPKSDIGLWKVAKVLDFLATFLIRPCTFMGHLDLMLWTADQLAKPI